VTGALAAITGGAVAAASVPTAIARAPAALFRTNVSGQAVPAVLGGPLAAGSVAGLGVLAAVGPPPHRRAARTVGVLVLVTAVGGFVDDLRGDERERGFRGHLRAALAGNVTGGVVKIVAAGAGGLLAGASRGGRGPVVETAALVSLAANLVNLLDRAPGRAAKTSLAAALPLAARGGPWAVASAPLWGALLACLPADLGERAMLGDAGANPLGAVLGWGAASTLGRSGRIVALASLAALNAASERWSFSRAIEGSRLLRALDLIGRPRRGHPPTPC
jgi:UDP-GlcNAc:undecaprenyl-phosphate GlcNAc-1-phosphate transferase